LQQKYFANARELLVTVRSSDPEISRQVASNLVVHLLADTNLVRDARWQAPWLQNPGDAARNLGWIWLQQPPSAFNELAERLSTNHLGEELTAAREALASSLSPQEIARRSYDPLGFTALPNSASMTTAFDSGGGIFANADETYRVVFVEPANDRMSYREAARWIDEVKLSVAAATTGAAGDKPGLTISYTGGPAFLAEIALGMESDLKSSILSTVAVIGLLFWLAHRSWRPLGWLIFSLGLTLAITMALGGLIFGTLNVVSLGFAAVLLGLAVDYGLVSFQEFIASPGKSLGEIRHEVAPGIWYSAFTTACTFSLLSLAGLPGLAQMGVLTALGLMTGAAVMLYVYLPIVAQKRRPAHAPGKGQLPVWMLRSWRPTILVLAAVVAVLGWRGIPRLNGTSDPLRPRGSAAYAAMDELKSQLGRTNDPVWILCVGSSAEVVGQQLAKLEAQLSQAQAGHQIASYTLPTSFWPRPDYERVNRPQAAKIAPAWGAIREAALEAGFTTNALMLAEGALAEWRNSSNDALGSWPDNPTAHWLSSQFAAEAPDGTWLALGLIQPGAAFDLLQLEASLPPGVTAASWDRLSMALLQHVLRRVFLITGLILAMLVTCLWVAFRNWRELALSFAALVLSFGCLLTVMTCLGWSWNLLSLVALPLLLGSSVDSTIHVQLALRRHGRDLRELWRTTGKALALCAGANIAGFGSLAFSNNAGLASLDLVCAIGVACVFVVCLGLLPVWWYSSASEPGKSSVLYNSWWWNLGLWSARAIPEPVLATVARFIALGYRVLNPTRFQVVTANLLPVVGGDRRVASQVARRNIAQFSRKLVDLWRWEAGLSIDRSVQFGEGREHFLSALQSGRGVLLVTLHLGNWEFGAALLGREGVKPLVLTAQEPAARLTELRAASRARHGIETWVVGADPFGFVEVIKRLDTGGMVAILLDRPAAATAVEVDFFGQPFHASIAAAELARASGCIVLPVVIVREGNGYRGHALPSVPYDRAGIRSKEQRVAFTREILQAFEPSVRRYADQWYHFVPIWPEPAKKKNADLASP
jgi:predicted exporter/lauroyl/myristoyl acyltransferase